MPQVRYQSKGDKHVDTANFNKIAGVANGLCNIFGMDPAGFECVRQIGTQRYIVPATAGGDAFPFGDTWLFGIIYIDGTTVRVNEGEIQIGENAAVAASTTNVTINNDYDKVGIEYVHGTSPTLSIVNHASSVTYEAGKTKAWLYSFRKTGNSVTLYRVNPWGLFAFAVWGGPPT